MAKVKSKKSKYISYLLRIIVAAGALYLTFRGENLAKIANVLLGINFWIFAASLVTWFLSQVVFVARWCLLMRAQSIHIGFWPAFNLNLLGIFYNNCLPTAIGGDLVRAWYVTNHTDKKLEAALSVLVDRAIGLAGTVIMAFCCYWLIPVDRQKERLIFSFNLNLSQIWNEHKWILAAIGIAFVLSLLAFISNAKGRNLLRKAFRLVDEKGKIFLHKISNAIRIYCSKIFTLILALLLTFLCQSIFIFGMWLVGREIGIDVPMKYYFVFFPIAWVVGSLPISIGALGIWEGTLKLLFGKVAVGLDEQVLALASYHRILWLIGSLPGVVIHLLGAHLPKDFFVDRNKSID
ncbi:MAG: lysylphosphatidylglycerol synthase transmembrane domain-containing protein [Phycisphaerae bacterium]|nr:lysylphosphatidylglycerol synthase transmembrane domain-containing protein [Phycisphaerae bacterium]MDD5381360.1 lysylphosphatidylglycerol synthase transmembrane domain-containing protein [Phycisphaerae bacterium]